MKVKLLSNRENVDDCVLANERGRMILRILKFIGKRDYCVCQEQRRFYNGPMKMTKFVENPPYGSFYSF